MTTRCSLGSTKTSPPLAANISEQGTEKSYKTVKNDKHSQNKHI